MNIKMTLRSNSARFLFSCGLTRPGWRARDSFSIVTFHRVLPASQRTEYPYPGLVVTPEELEDLLAYFTRHFDCGTLADQHSRFLNSGHAAPPLLAITFDDAQFDNFRYARPVLARFNVSASFFVPVTAVETQEPLWHDRLGFAALRLIRDGGSGIRRLHEALSSEGLTTSGRSDSINDVVQQAKGLELGARLRLVQALTAAAGFTDLPEFARMMTFDELAELAKDGHEIGSHSMTHSLMPECDDRTLDYEVGQSRLTLQARLGLPIESFCYPNGNSDTRSANAVAKAGYCRAVTTDWGSNQRDADRFRLRRCDMDAGRLCGANGRIVPAVVAFRMSGFYPGLG
jgi:peptidoglycan/xylan/chitin deacetylase (PgdA/CDA1 family)